MLKKERLLYFELHIETPFGTIELQLPSVVMAIGCNIPQSKLSQPFVTDKPLALKVKGITNAACEYFPHAYRI
jgi:hypothetical protein